MPHANTNTLNTIQGSQACITIELECLGGVTPTLFCTVPLSRSCPLSAVVVQIVLGRQIFRNPVRQAIDTIAATMSTSHGPWKFETRNCGIAKVTPATRIAGQICTMPRQPANAQISQNGTM